MSASEIQVMESELYEFLPPLDEGELETIFEKMQVTCPDGAKGKKNILLRLLFKQMTVLLADGDNQQEGFATLKTVHEYVTSIQGVKVEDDTKLDAEAEELRKFEALLDKKILDMKTEAASGLMDKKILDLKAQVAPSTVGELKVSKFTALKINGTIGTKAGCMSYTDLNFQISNAQKQGYTDEQITGAVIKAMSTNNNLRTYFESVPDVKLQEMLEILRPYFEQKNSAALFADLCNAAQASEQNCMDFVVGLLGLKLRILDLSTEEGVPMDNQRLVGQFSKSLFTGIRNTNIRTDIREFCRGNPKATDQQLIKVVAEAMAIERDRAQKMAGGADVCYVGVDQDKGLTDSQTVKPVTNNNKKKENLLPAQILELQASQERLVATVSEIQSSMAATNNLLAARFQDDYKHNNFSIPNYFPNFPQNFPPNFQGNANFSTGPMGPQQQSQNQNPNKNSKNQNNKKSNKCNSCLVNKALNCNHCFRCGSEGHKMEACPNQYKKNNNNPNAQGGGQPGGQGGQQGQAAPPPWSQNMQGPWMGPNQNGPWNMQPGQGGQQGPAGPQAPWNLNAPVWNSQNTQGGAQQQQGPGCSQGPWGQKNC